MLEWLVIGGGVQGSYLSHVLSSRCGLGPEQLRVLDPHQDPLACWHATTDNCGMQFLRSPAAHHIGLRTNDLLDFAHERYQDWRQQFLEPYLRPSLELWNAHAGHVIATQRLKEFRVAGSALAISRVSAGYMVQTNTGEIAARRLILAPGNSQPLEYPELEGGFPLNDPRVRHVFDPRFSRLNIPDAANVAIIGSGVTAAQLALSLCSRPAALHMFTNRLPQLSWFDSDPGWNGPRLLDRLAEIDDPQQRLATVSTARIKGSFPGDTAAPLLAAQLAGKLSFHLASLRTIEVTGSQLCLESADGNRLVVDQVVFATGFSSQPPALQLVTDTSMSLGLPMVGTGWPVVDDSCEWGKNIYVCGALAQLSLGPVARNISGVRSFARRLLGNLHVYA